ncbi:2,3-diaminopropionate biosynthesis protein SbnB [Actinophytocola xanthii]|uniref:2,3-diaminopropionate biosynthesis protein SbnB n=1 Tax=Actinophytocola xanthii TaxID=1912961 RepID=A0A1Q8CK18_9PSEU|nr:2,3-diaminopropionate biosynthesis protein SbnB [Actinophytocola xanthii]OLF14692.1 2,3-diaminopropionate biosynthesis protein SbnB [Actinophytocola xanthii]
MTEFHVVPGPVVADVLARSHQQVMSAVADAYLAHENGEATIAPSAFLRFPDRPNARVIALSAHLKEGNARRVGMKWISSFPDNVARGEHRASAVIVLNDHETGRPVACLEGARISAARTGAAAAVAARLVLGDRLTGGTVGFVGSGPIAASVLDHVLRTPVPVTEVVCHDLDAASSAAFARHAARAAGVPARAVAKAEALAADLVVLATSALAPHIGTETVLRPGQVVLNISLRDLAPELLLDAHNVVDDVDHCLRADTSPHLAEQLSGSRAFVSATIGQLLAGRPAPDHTRPVVVSPFGLGVLDVAVAGHVLDEAIASGGAVPIPDFLGDVRREHG